MNGPVLYVEVNFPYHLVASSTLDSIARGIEQAAWGEGRLQTDDDLS